MYRVMKANDSCTSKLLALGTLLLWVSLCICHADEESQTDGIEATTNSTPPSTCAIDGDGACAALMAAEQAAFDDECSECATYELYEFFECDKQSENSVAPLHNESIWMLLRGTYQATVGIDYSSIAPITTQDGFLVPYYAGYSVGAGRGVFAGAFIAKGTKVWQSRQTAKFWSGGDFRHFLFSLPQNLACDVLQWSYVSPGNETIGEEPFIGCDLDNGSFGNGEDAYRKPTGHIVQDDIVLGRHANGSLWTRSGLVAYANQDIEAGTEFISNYYDFSDHSLWANFGLG